MTADSTARPLETINISTRRREWGTFEPKRCNVCDRPIRWVYGRCWDCLGEWGNKAARPQKQQLEAVRLDDDGGGIN